MKTKQNAYTIISYTQIHNHTRGHHSDNAYITIYDHNQKA